MADSSMVNWQNPILPLIQSVLGGQSETDINKDETSTTKGTTTQNTTGTTNQNTTGTSTSNTKGTSTQTTSADISRLLDVYNKQAAGITPEMLTAIFSEGAKKVPGLTTAYANAVGARSSDNRPLATNIRDLQASLTNQAAMLSNQMLRDSGLTAQQIADFTKTVTGTNTSNTTGTTNQNTTGTTTQNTTGTTDSTTDTDTNQSIDQTNTVNTDVLKVLAGLGIGGSVLDSVLGGNGTTGGLTDLLGKVTGVVPSALQQLLGGSGTSGLDLTGTWNGLFGENSLQNWLDTNGIDWGGNFNDLLSGSGADGFNFDFNNIDWSGDVGDFLDFGWADGGSVKKSDADAQMIQRQQLLEKLMSDPRGQALLYAKAKQSQQKYSAMGADDWRKANKEWMKKNNYEAPTTGWLDAVIGGTADNPDVAAQFNKQRELSEKGTMDFIKSLPPGAQRQYLQVMQKDLAGNKFNQFMDKIMPMIPAAVAGIGAGGALGILGSGMSSAAGFGAAGASGGLGSGMGNLMLRQLLSKGINMGVSKLADGGTPRRAGDPIVGTRGPDRVGSGGGGLSKEAIDEAIRKLNEKKQPPAPQRGSGGLSLPTRRALNELDNYAEGGHVTGNAMDHMADPEGINDTVDAKLSVNEYVIPSDVVDTLGKDFFDHILERYHTPVEMQKAMGVGGVSQ